MARKEKKVTVDSVAELCLKTFFDLSELASMTPDKTPIHEEVNSSEASTYEEKSDTTIASMKQVFEGADPKDLPFALPIFNKTPIHE